MWCFSGVACWATLGAPYRVYRRAFKIIEEPRPAEATLQHAFRTSGMLINESRCKFFVDQRASVGVSYGRAEAFS